MNEWVQQSNLKGPKGDKGDQGDPGADGAPGAPGADGVVQAIVEGARIGVDATDPANPIVSADAAAWDDITGKPSTFPPTLPIPSSGVTDLDAAQAAQDAAIATKAATTYVDSQNAAQDAVIAGKAPLASPAFTGNPTAPTPTAGDNDTSIATTAFVQGAVGAGAWVSKGSIVDSDLMAGFDSAASYAKSWWSWATIKEAARAFVVAASNVFTGKTYFQANKTGNSGMATATSDLGEIEVRGNSTGAAMMTFQRVGAWAAYLGLDTDNVWKVGGWSMGAAAYKLLHEGLTGLFSLSSSLFIKQGSIPVYTGTASWTPPVTGSGNMVQVQPPAGAWTLNPPGTAVECFTMVLLIYNANGVSTCTFSGWTKVSGDTLPTSSGAISLVYITRFGGQSTAFVERLAGS